MERQHYPGMKVLLFGFGGHLLSHPYLPHNFKENCIVYTGTHDNNTAAGWYATEATKEDKKQVDQYLRRKSSAKKISWDLIELAFNSVAQTAIVPVQDLLGLGADTRMNTPSTTVNNWLWRLRPNQITAHLTDRLRKLTVESDRQA